MLVGTVSNEIYELEMGTADGSPMCIMQGHFNRRKAADGGEAARGSGAGGRRPIGLGEAGLGGAPPRASEAAGRALSLIHI